MDVVDGTDGTAASGDRPLLLGCFVPFSALHGLPCKSRPDLAEKP